MLQLIFCSVDFIELNTGLSYIISYYGTIKEKKTDHHQIILGYQGSAQFGRFNCISFLLLNYNSK
jgi:hypothetical protein